MDHAQVSSILIALFLAQRPGWRILPNRSGEAVFDGAHVPYGVPPGGGGADFLTFGPDARCEWWEVKTLAYPLMSKKQKRVATVMVEIGQTWYIFRETAEAPYYTIRQWVIGLNGKGREEVCTPF